MNELDDDRVVAWWSGGWAVVISRVADSFDMVISFCLSHAFLLSKCKLSHNIVSQFRFS